MHMKPYQHTQLSTVHTHTHTHTSCSAHRCTLQAQPHCNTELHSRLLDMSGCGLRREKDEAWNIDVHLQDYVMSSNIADTLWSLCFLLSGRWDASWNSLDCRQEFIRLNVSEAYRVYFRFIKPKMGKNITSWSCRVALREGHCSECICC